MIDLKKLIENSVHFGHQKSKWNPLMEPFIWGHKNNIHLIDVSKTASQIEKAGKFLESIAAENKSILLVGTKKAAQDVIYKISQELGLPYVVNRWVGGTFSNYKQVRKSVANLLHYEDVLEKSKELHYSKKELNVFHKRAERLEKSVGGIRKLTWPVGAVLVVDVKKESVCVKEAVATGIPVVAIVDTNSNPTGVDYVIPGNDDAPRSIRALLDYVAGFIKKGQETASSKSKEPKEENSVFESVFTEEDNLNGKTNNTENSSIDNSGTDNTNNTDNKEEQKSKQAKTKASLTPKTVKKVKSTKKSDSSDNKDSENIADNKNNLELDAKPKSKKEPKEDKENKADKKQDIKN